MGICATNKYYIDVLGTGMVGGNPVHVVYIVIGSSTWFIVLMCVYVYLLYI